MSLTTIILLSWLVPAALAWRPVAGHIAWFSKGNHYGRPQDDDWAWGIFIGFLLCAVWPAALAGYIAVKLGNRLPKVGAEKRGLAELRKRELERAEKELGLGEQGEVLPALREEYRRWMS